MTVDWTSDESWCVFAGQLVAALNLVHALRQHEHERDQHEPSSRQYEESTLAIIAKHRQLGEHELWAAGGFTRPSDVARAGQIVDEVVTSIAIELFDRIRNAHQEGEISDNSARAHVAFFLWARATDRHSLYNPPGFLF